VKLVILLAVVLILAAAAKWAFCPSRNLPVNRVRHTRIRLRLRLHPGRGFASAFECWLRWGRLASFRGSKRARPSLTFWQRALCAAAYSVLVGRAHYGLRLRVSVQESITITAPPRAGKTGMLADLVLRFPGPAVATSVKSDIYELTSGIRAQLGPIAVFNPQRVGDLPSTFAWSPVAGCRDPEVAARRAEAFTGAISVKGTEQQDFWAQQASEFFRATLMAADLAGGDMRLVAQWLMGSAEEAEAILQRAGQTQWATSLAQLRSPAERTISTIRLLHNKALSFLGNPALAASVLPPDGAGFDIPEFLAARGTLYLIAEAQTEEAPVAPLMACFLNEVHYTAKLAGSRMSGGRLDPPLLMALDEIANIAPIAIPNFMADAGGRGIQMAIVYHGLGQLRDRWGEQGAQIISDTAGCKVFLPGITDTTLLKAASELCGQTAFLEKRREHFFGGREHYREEHRFSRHDICEPAMLRELPDGYALLVRGGRAPVLAKLPRAWTDRAYKRARRQGRAIYHASAPITLPAIREFALPPQLTLPPGGAAGSPPNGNGHHSSGNGHGFGNGYRPSGDGHPDPAEFPWGGEDQ
jgi:type IV secretory pathway TraG/TraD family ATPase VirD4